MNSENGDIMFMLEQLRNSLQSARKVPLLDEMYWVNRTELMDIVEDIIAAFPPEIARAKEIVNTQSRYIEDAKREAEELREAAKREVERLIEKDEIVRQAKERARQIAALTRKKFDEDLSKAEAQAAEIRRTAKSGTEDAFRKVDGALTKAHDELRQAWQSFRGNERSAN